MHEDRQHRAERQRADDLATAWDASPLQQLRDDENVRDRDEEAVADDRRCVLERVLVVHHERIVARLEESAAERVHEECSEVRPERDSEQERRRPLLGERLREGRGAIAIRAESRERGRKSFSQFTPP